MQLSLKVEGEDGYVLNGASNMSKISRDPAELVGQMIGPNHQYPDGAVLFLGTLFAPVEDRDAPGKGFTHKLGDVVTVSQRRTRHAGQPHDELRQGRTLDLWRQPPDAQPGEARVAVGRNSRRDPLTLPSPPVGERNETGIILLFLSPMGERPR